MPSKRQPKAVRPSSTRIKTSRVLERLRQICLAMPGATEKVSQGMPTWFAGPEGRVFAVFDDHHHGAKHASVWLPVPRDIQEALVASEPRSYFIPPYLGSKGWVAVVLDVEPDWATVEQLVWEAFGNVVAQTKGKGPPN